MRRNSSASIEDRPWEKEEYFTVDGRPQWPDLIECSVPGLLGEVRTRPVHVRYEYLFCCTLQTLLDFDTLYHEWESSERRSDEIFKEMLVSRTT